MIARSPNEAYLTINQAASYYRGLFKFVDLSVNFDIEWFIKEAFGSRS